MLQGGRARRSSFLLGGFQPGGRDCIFRSLVYRRGLLLLSVLVGVLGSGLSSSKLYSPAKVGMVGRVDV